MGAYVHWVLISACNILITGLEVLFLLIPACPMFVEPQIK